MKLLLNYLNTTKYFTVLGNLAYKPMFGTGIFSLYSQQNIEKICTTIIGFFDRKSLKQGSMSVQFSSQGKLREFAKNTKNQGKLREFDSDPEGKGVRQFGVCVSCAMCPS